MVWEPSEASTPGRKCIVWMYVMGNKFILFFLMKKKIVIFQNYMEWEKSMCFLFTQTLQDLNKIEIVFRWFLNKCIYYDKRINREINLFVICDCHKITLNKAIIVMNTVGMCESCKFFNAIHSYHMQNFISLCREKSFFYMCRFYITPITYSAFTCISF